LYPDIVDVARGDFSTPLQLRAYNIEFEDPMSGRLRRFVSERSIDP
jgi:tRNA pseudouridine32 synthase/23S rRNA pseudouridine746 synthase